MHLDWHTKTEAEVFLNIGSNPHGLSDEEVLRRHKIYGSNDIEVVKHISAISRFLLQFHNILIYALLISAIITLAIGHLIDASVIFGVVILNAFFGFIQEGKAQKAIESIRASLAPNATVIRGGNYATIQASSLVPGDIVILKSGDKVPADIRLLNIKNLQIQEAILTGESNATEKNIIPLQKDTPLAERLNMAYSGTNVINGKGTGVVIAIGGNTEIGKIGALLKQVKPLETPLLQQMNIFSKWLTLAIIILAVITFAIGVIIWNDSLEQAFMAAVGLSVAAIPEGLPPILTIILAIGVTKMARRNAVIRSLPAVETMGAITTICTDKTGTLTRNEQTVKNIITSNNYYHVAENGDVKFSIDATKININDHLDLLASINLSVLCNDGDFIKINEESASFHGNPIDKALLELANKVKIDLHLLQQKYPRTDLIPYESEHKFMATLHHNHINKTFIYVKGAPERILEMCSHEISNGIIKDINLEYWQENIEILTHQGYRVIAIASKETTTGKDNLLFEDTKENLVITAIFGLIDAPRPEAIEAIKKCYAAGIKVKMITGDHATTAATIANQVGIENKSGVLTGDDIDKMNDLELERAVAEINVYARTTPQHKLRLVNALQANGELVAMTGDGVNDAPALRKANIGIAMGKRGAEIAKEAAAMILTDDNFTTIVHAIEEGRTVYDNLKKVLLFILPTNAAEAFTVIMAIIFGFMLPITAVQILWINMITATTLAVALGFEPAEKNIMHRPPRKPNTPILSGFLIWRIALVTILIVSCVFGLFVFQRTSGVDLLIARTTAVNMLVFGEIIYLVNCRKIYGQAWHFKTLFGSKPILLSISAAILLQLFFTYTPIMQRFFGAAPINLSQWGLIILLSCCVFLLVELEKLFISKIGMNFKLHHVK